MRVDGNNLTGAMALIISEAFHWNGEKKKTCELCGWNGSIMMSDVCF